ncbi:MAG: hypothetical protein HQ521_06370 [Bacteroidetes bacterium]|nr:hypothetical protein [Bacteroidota bacterium]
MQTGNKGEFLSTDLGLMVYNDLDEKERFADYMEYLDEKGGLETGKEPLWVKPDLLIKLWYYQ